MELVQGKSRYPALPGGAQVGQLEAQPRTLAEAGKGPDGPTAPSGGHREEARPLRLHPPGQGPLLRGGGGYPSPGLAIYRSSPSRVCVHLPHKFPQPFRRASVNYPI